MDLLNLYILTFNCARSLIDPEDFSSHLFDALSSSSPNPELLVFSLQEVAPIAYGFLGGSLLTPYFSAFEDAVRIAASKLGLEKYILLNSSNVGMTALMVFAQEDVAGRIRWVETAATGVGLWEMGNKGAVGMRIGYSLDDGGITELTFVGAHLAPAERGIENRNSDWADIVKRLVFVSDDSRIQSNSLASTSRDAEEEHPLLSSQDNFQPTSGIYKSTSHLFLAGDLNYRTASRKPMSSDILTFPALLPSSPAERSSSPALAPAYTSFLARDQLTHELREGRTLHYFAEPPITFPPTYKYTPFGTWAPQRWPSWCDRILYLAAPSKNYKIHKYTSLPWLPISDHRPVVLSLSIPMQPIEPQAEETVIQPPFPIDEKWRRRRELARQKELVVGILAWISLTREGITVVFGTMVGILGVWFIFNVFSSP